MKLKSLIEVARMDTTKYVKSHGKEPKGSGGWMFVLTNNPRDEKSGEKFGLTGSYAVAKRHAIMKATEMGKRIVVVMP